MCFYLGCMAHNCIQWLVHEQLETRVWGARLSLICFYFLSCSSFTYTLAAIIVVLSEEGKQVWMQLKSFIFGNTTSRKITIYVTENSRQLLFKGLQFFFVLITIAAFFLSFINYIIPLLAIDVMQKVKDTYIKNKNRWNSAVLSR